MTSNHHNSVLIIDDETEICFLLANVLKKKKLETFIANSVEEGYYKLNTDPKILFLDIHLPDGSGLDLLKKIRKDYPELKIIIISAYDSEKERNEARQNGADAFIAKPFNSNIIFETIKELA